MSEEPDFDPDAIMDAMAPLLGLTIEDVYRAGVATNLRICAQFAALVTSADLDQREEPAPVFSA